MYLICLTGCDECGMLWRALATPKQLSNKAPKVCPECDETVWVYDWKVDAWETSLMLLYSKQRGNVTDFLMMRGIYAIDTEDSTESISARIDLGY